MIVIGNMKMNLTLEEIKDYIKNFPKNDNVVICPTSIYIPYFLDYNVGIQNISDKTMGAYTGEVSSKQCRSMGIEYTIIGHSERRSYYNETDAIINEKIKVSLENDLKVILCIGEKDGENSKQVIFDQLKNDLKMIENIDNIIIAYEPIWAIGTNVTPTNDQIEEIIKYIKELIILSHNKNIKVLYGGSVNEKNISSLCEIPNVDGFLVGGASTKINEFNKIIEVACK